MKTKLRILAAGVLLATVGTGLSQPCITITTEPQGQTYCTGSPLILSVVATGAEPLRYQWQQAFDYYYYVDRPDETNSTLIITNFQNLDTGNYRVIITNAECSVTSAVALLRLAWVPTISVQPTNFAPVSPGGSAANRVGASGGAMIAYQWRFKGTDLAGQTKSTISLADLQTANEGSYDVVVANLCGSVTSRVATLTVDPTFTQITTGVLVTDTVGAWNASWVDYDSDGRLDFSAAQGGYSSAVTLLYHNEGDGTFRKVTTNAIAQTGVRAFTHVWGDYDNDGKLDLFVPNVGTMNDMLFHNIGSNSFTRITTGHPVIDGADSICGVWVDYDRDGFLDIFVSMGQGCPGQNDLLYRNNGDGTFRKMTIPEVGLIVGDSLKGDYVTWADVDNDGWPELSRTVANECTGTSWTNQLLHLDSQGKFYLMDIGEMKKGNQGFTAIRLWADYDNDGFLDAFVQTERGLLGLYRNVAGLGFTDVADSAFPNLPTNASAWGMGDYDNDGWLDVLVYTDASPTPALFRNNGNGTFTSKTVGGPTSAPGWHVWGDYNNDGFMDVWMYDGVRRLLFQHNGNTNHWLKVKLDGRASNRSGIGAKVRVNSTIGGRNFWQMREISGQELAGYANGLIAHFGLGDATTVTNLRIEWPSGIVQELPNVAANQFLTVVESQGYPGAAPQFSGVTDSPDGPLLSFAEPAAGVRYTVEASTNLIHWTKLVARTSLGVATNFTDLRATNYTRRYYRLLVP